MCSEVFEKLLNNLREKSSASPPPMVAHVRNHANDQQYTYPMISRINNPEKITIINLFIFYLVSIFNTLCGRWKKTRKKN